MLSLFNKLTSGKPEIRVKREVRFRVTPTVYTNTHVFCWLQHREEMNKKVVKKLSIGPWNPLKVNPGDLPFNIKS